MIDDNDEIEKFREYEVFGYLNDDDVIPSLLGIRKDAPKEAKKAFKAYMKKYKEIRKEEEESGACIY